MSKASHKMTSALRMGELMARISRLGKACNRPISQKEVEVICAWIDATLFDYYLVQGILTGKICVQLPAEEVISVEQFAEAMKLSAATRVKARLN